MPVGPLHVALTQRRASRAKAAETVGGVGMDHDSRLLKNGAMFGYRF